MNIHPLIALVVAVAHAVITFLVVTQSDVVFEPPIRVALGAVLVGLEVISIFIGAPLARAIRNVVNR